MKALIAAVLLAATCTPTPSNQDPPVPPAFGGQDSGSASGGFVSVSGACPDARQHYVEMGCPPAEAYFGEWESVCSAKPNGQAIANCILSKSVCIDARNCEE